MHSENHALVMEDDDENVEQTTPENNDETILNFESLKPSPTTANLAKEQQKLDESLLKKNLVPSKFGTNIERFHHFCKDFPSPNLFIDFDFYFMIAACLNRKVWTGGRGSTRIFPNQFTVAVGPPGVGKSMPAKVVGSMLRKLVENKLIKEGNQTRLVETPLLNLGPDTITFEKLVLRCAASTDTEKMSEDMIARGYKKIYNHSSTTFCLADELTMLFTENTKRVVSFLQTAWDCDKFEGDTIKHGVVKINNICVNLLGCAPIDIIRDLSRTGVFNGGFIARTLFLFGDKKRQNIPRIIISAEQENEQDHIMRHLRKLCKLQPQEISYTKEADEWIDNWVRTKSDTHLNTHKTTLDYYARKNVHIQKFAIAIHYSERTDGVIGVESFEKALKLLERAELEMHKALSATGDNAQFIVMEGIKEYLEKHGPTKQTKLKLEFFNRLDEEGIMKVIDFLVNNEICSACSIDGKRALKMKE